MKIAIAKMMFRGQEVEVTEDFRCLKNQSPKKFYYEMRHGESDWGEPVTVEPAVLCNRWGVMKAKSPLKFRQKLDPYILLTRKEKDNILRVLGHLLD
jgi:hypothetical protein